MDMTLKIAVCDDDADFVDRLSKQVMIITAKKGCSCELAKLYSGTELINHCQYNAVDIILTDIDMPETDFLNLPALPNTAGFKAAKELLARYPNTELVFVSAHEELAYQSFRYRPFSFISKNDLIFNNNIKMLEDDLSELIDKIINQKMVKILFPLELGGKKYNINTAEILYFKTDKHYLFPYTAKGQGQPYRCNIREAYKQLSEAYFIYVHRSYLVNCRHIEYFDTQNVILSNKETINVTRDEQRLKESQKIFSRYKRRQA